MDELTDEYADWLEEHATDEWIRHDIQKMDAHEIMMVDAAVYAGTLLTDDQRRWLRDFISRWDRQQALVDRLERLVA